MTENHASDQSPQPGQSSQPALPTRLTPGQPAPDFTLPAVNPDGGETSVTLSRLLAQGKRVVLYFYPAAMTPGCTTQACGVQEALPQLGKLGLEVIGVSPDPIPPIDKFAQTYGLEFPLASDEDHKVAEAYGVWVEKSMYGKTYMGMERSSFLVGADGKIVKVWRKVKPEEHAAAVLAAAKALG